MSSVWAVVPEDIVVPVTASDELLFLLPQENAEQARKLNAATVDMIFFITPVDSCHVVHIELKYMSIIFLHTLTINARAFFPFVSEFNNFV
jgi:hypothetical protein